MYIAEIFSQWRARRRQASSANASAERLPPTVYALGGTSMLTDVSTEMVASILPVYLLIALRLSPAEYGLVDGLFRGGAAIAAVLLGGFLSYRSGRIKLVAGLGYTLSALTKLILLASSAFSAIAASLILDRLGKGLRVAPRDAMLAASVPSSQLGLAFGVHRAMDGLGAVAGPLLAAFVLWQVPNGYDTVFKLSLCAALFGLLVFFRFVRVATTLAESEPASRPAIHWRQRIPACLPPASRRLLWFAMLLTLFTVSEGMMYAHIQRSFALEPHIQPLLPVATATVFLLLAAPIGYLADRLGAVRVFCGAHGLLVPLYILLSLSGADGESLWLVAMLIFLLGCFFAATDGVLMAAVAATVPSGSRSMSLALFAAGLALMKMLSSAVFGLLWDRLDITWAVLIYGSGLCSSLAFFLWANPFRALLPVSAVTDAGADLH